MSEVASIPAVPPALLFDWKTVENGVPLSALKEFADFSGFTVKDLQEVVIPPRTLKHRRQRKEPLSLDESDRLARVARLYGVAVRVFGNPDKARHFLSRPIRRFHERTPLSMMRTDAGARQVEEVLIQIDEGMFA